MGGELTYTCLGNNQYELTLIVYRDCNGINLGASQTVYQSDDCGSTVSYTMSQVSFQEITPVCANVTGTACNGGGGTYGIEEFVYQTTVTLDPNCTNVNFFWSLCCRNNAINTLSSPGSESMYIHTSIPDVNVCNISPTFLNNPTPFVCVGQPVNYNHGAVDTDGDDLIFSLIDCMDDASTPVTYATGFSATNPLTTSTGVTIDAATGALSFTPSQVQVGVLCVLVEEYRNGIKISEIVRDIQFTVLTCSNDNPTLTGMDSSNTFSTSLKVGNSLCFDVFSDDINAGQVVSMEWNEGISTGTFTIDSSGQFPEGTFCWTPTVDDIGTNIFTVTVADDNCPLVGMNTYTFNIDVSIDTVQSIVDGNWSSAATWDCNCIPNSLHNIIVHHNVVLATNFTLGDGGFLLINTGGNLAISDTYGLTIDGEFNNYGTLQGDLIINGTSSKFVRLGNLEKVEITNPTSVLVAADCNISKKLTLSNGDFNSNGYNVILRSDTTGSALVEDNGGTCSGDLIVQRYLFNTIGHHFICSPFSDATVNELDDDFSLSLNAAFPHIYYYDETDTSIHSSDGWLSPASTAHLMGQAEGYSCYFMAGSGITLDMTGSINTGSITIPLTHTTNSTIDTGSCPPEGWNLVGNPYPSPLDFDLLMQAAPAEVEKALYIWDPTSKSYLSYVDGIGSPSNFGAIVPSMQGFWIKANSTTTLSFDNSMRITDPSTTTNTFYKSLTPNAPIFRLEMGRQGQKTEIVTRFKVGATTGFDSNFDAFFIPSEYPGFVDFAVATGEGPLGINSLPPLQTMPVIIPLHHKVDQGGSYTIELTEFTNFGPNDQVILEDATLGINHVLNNAAYTFTASPTDNPRRFNLRVIPAVISHTDRMDDQNDLKIHKCNDGLCLSFPEEIVTTADLRIYDRLGQLVYQTTLSEGQQEYLLDNINLQSPNLYFVKIETLNYNKTQSFAW
ncbi:T9SS type A sorting domain-containing protein [Aureispira anguillae]|uniref:T9SS type A sorting domain-containing protein n=1 Tax=Aureispira anguillae TaxID=2864201 RepID=A0A915VK33_9BACT|nr:T9SS type A sorting domain-containing protein [Aureispira anguillae]BDS09469.1 T9SS type A sorting domain-containing protein [Aureispira anguillae]